MMKKVHTIVRHTATALLTLISASLYAQGEQYAGPPPSTSPYYYAGPAPIPAAPVVSADSSSSRPENPDAVYMAADLFIARPLMFATTVAGTGVYILSLPFSFLGGNMEQARQELVVEPFNETFKRCLGCDGNSDTGNLIVNN